MPGHSPSEDGRERPYVPGIHLPFVRKMDCRDKPGNDTLIQSSVAPEARTIAVHFGISALM
jgi:hypothetical protein